VTTQTAKQKLAPGISCRSTIDASAYFMTRTTPSFYRFIGACRTEGIVQGWQTPTDRWPAAIITAHNTRMIGQTADRNTVCKAQHVAFARSRAIQMS
jgi:hypothetical protein